MSFDLKSLTEAVNNHGKVCRLVVVKTEGSTPRENGAAMLVWDTGQSGSIGGGTLELEATERARNGLHDKDWIERYALGPALGQCCGGAVTLVAENYDIQRVNELDESVVIRQITGTTSRPDQMHVSMAQATGDEEPINLRFQQGWLMEWVTRPTSHLWIFGAGHVGRALVAILDPIPEIGITWVDATPDRFPKDAQTGPDRLVTEKMAEAVRFAPLNAQHVIATYSHDIDLEICHGLLSHGFKTAGLIGSETKWRRFQSRLRNLGHPQSLINRITCPIGNPELGKQPQAIAISVAAQILAPEMVSTAEIPNLREVGDE